MLPIHLSPDRDAAVNASPPPVNQVEKSHFDIFLETLDQQIIDYRAELSGAWFWHLKGYQESAVKKLATDLNRISQLILLGRRPPAECFIPCIKAIACIKAVYDEMERRENNTLNRVFRVIFSNKLVVKGSYILSGLGATVASISIASAFLFDNGPIFISLTFLGILFTAIGGSSALVSGTLENYYTEINVSKSEKDMANAFIKYLHLFINNDWKGVFPLINGLSLANQMDLPDPYVLANLIKFSPIHHLSTQVLGMSRDGSDQHDATPEYVPAAAAATTIDLDESSSSSRHLHGDVILPEDEVVPARVSLNISNSGSSEGSPPHHLFDEEAPMTFGHLKEIIKKLFPGLNEGVSVDATSSSSASSGSSESS